MPVVVTFTIIGVAIGIGTVVLLGGNRPATVKTADNQVRPVPIPLKAEGAPPKSDAPKSEPASHVRVERKEVSQPLASPFQVREWPDLTGVLDKAKRDEFYLADVNKAGIRAVFDAANYKVTLKNELAQITKHELSILNTKYDFDGSILSVLACSNLTFTDRIDTRQILLPDFYLAFRVKCSEMEARKWSTQFKERKLKLDVTFRITRFSTVTEESTTGRQIENGMVETEVIHASLQ